ncbi:hypothetical protein CRG98_038725 [Punica granatum]|uniref:CCHC-type domain-containing protein n=1 Tax=Punica granatum TaxID=22663 RepID=A0A2I0IA48_PUNGR|nr:hypothetical protein CRG98_038725 [Punica granatum]
MDLDYGLREEEPPAPMDIDAPKVKEKYECCEKSNRLSLMLMKSRVSKSIRGAVGEVTTAKDFLKAIKEQFAKSDKALATEYGPFKVSYNTHKEEWFITELLTMCVQEEEMMKHDKPEVAHLATRPKGKGKKDHGKRQYKVPPKMDGSKVKCFFCMKDGHVKKDCPKYKKCLEKRGLSQPKESNGK